MTLKRFQCYILKSVLSLTFIIFLGQSNLIAQEYTTKSKKAIKYFESALSDYRADSYKAAQENAYNALDKDENFSEAYLLLSDIYESTGNFTKQAEVLQSVLLREPTKRKMILLKLIETELKTGQYKSASNHIKELEKQKLPDFYRDNLRTFKEATEFALNAIENPVSFIPENCGNIVNSKNDDYFPAITADGTKLYKTVNLPTGKFVATGEEFHQEDLFVTIRKTDGTPLKTVPVSGKINTPGNEGAFTISQNGKELFFTVCSHSRGASYHGEVVGGCDIFIAEANGRLKQKIQNPKEPLNSPAWDAQPSFSSDGRTLYFVSNRKGGMGKDDIWKSVRDKNGKWSKPINLGKTINTSGSENTPFMHADNKTLYFSSDGHPGMGKHDIFMSRKDKNEKWSKPLNMGYPINTHENETGLIVDSQGDSAFFASKREDSYGGLDIYRFALDKNHKPDKTTYITGRVFNKKNNAPVQATIKLTNINSDQLRAVTESDAMGKYLICINSGSNYAFHVSKPGYMFYSGNFLLENMKNIKDKFIKNIPLTPIEEGKKTVLKNIYFDSDSFKLRTESFPELKLLTEFMKLNPTVHIEISGHTDNTGSATYNNNLSEQRAKAVFEYLIKIKSAKNRIQYKGYGSSKPLVKNNTPEHRQMNRRTEIKITKK